MTSLQFLFLSLLKKRFLMGFIRLRDPETGKKSLPALVQKNPTSNFERLVAKRSALAARLKGARLEPLFIENGGDYVSVLREFFYRVPDVNPMPPKIRVGFIC